MDEERSDYDVLEIDLPAYEEDSSAIPDIEPESSFSENKEEIYRRNSLMAADSQLELLSRLEDAKAERSSSGFAGFLRGILSALTDNTVVKIAIRTLLLFFVIVIVVLISIILQLMGRI